MTHRRMLDVGQLTEEVGAKMRAYHKDVIDQVENAIRKHDVVVVGMAQNPHVRKARRALEEAGVAFEYLEFGSYFSEWKRRLAIKLWSGWPTFPQVFVKGVLIGGRDAVHVALADGSLKRRLEPAKDPRESRLTN